MRYVNYITRKLEGKKKTYHALMPCGSLTTLFAHSISWLRSSSSKTEKEVVRNENNIHRDFTLSLGSANLLLAEEKSYNCFLRVHVSLTVGRKNFYYSIPLASNKSVLFLIYQSHWKLWNYQPMWQKILFLLGTIKKKKNQTSRKWPSSFLLHNSTTANVF